jgi:hypothetical protein
MAKTLNASEDLGLATDPIKAFPSLETPRDNGPTQPREPHASFPTGLHPSSAFRLPAFSPEEKQTRLADAAQKEQREVNDSVRTTFSAVHTTLRSQGAAIRGLDELFKRALPELDALHIKVGDRAAEASLRQLEAEVRKIDEALASAVAASAERTAATSAALETKFDVALGQRALDGLARVERHGELEQAAREAVTAEAARLSSEATVQVGALEALATRVRDLEPRVGQAEEYAASLDAQAEAERAEVGRLLACKAEAHVVAGLAAEVGELGMAATRRWERAETDSAAAAKETMGLLAEKMDRADAERSLDALASQLGAQSRDAAAAGATLAAAMAARLEETEAELRDQIGAVEARLAEARAESSAHVASLSQSVEASVAQQRGALRGLASSVEKESDTVRSALRLVGDRLGGIDELREEGLKTAREVVALRSALDGLSSASDGHAGQLTELNAAASKLAARCKAQALASDAMTGQLQVLTERVETSEDRLGELGHRVGSLCDEPAAATADELADLVSAQAVAESRIEARLAALERHVVEGERRTSGVQRTVAEATQERLEALEAQLGDAAAAEAKRDVAMRRAAASADQAAASAAAAAASAAAQPPPLMPPPAASPDDVTELKAELQLLRREQAAGAAQLQLLQGEVRALPKARAAAEPPSPGATPAGAASASGPWAAHAAAQWAGDGGAALASAIEHRPEGVEEATRAQEVALQRWSADHVEVLEQLLSHALSGRWIGTVGGGNTPKTVVVGSGSGVLVSWHEQASNSHATCFGWRAHARELYVEEAGLYEVSVGLWPAVAGLTADLRVDTASVLVFKDEAGIELEGGGAAGGEVRGLCRVTMLSLPAGAAVSLAAESSMPRTRAYLALRKL